MRWTLAAACAVVGCSPAPDSTDDVYPRNCGVEGPVDLFVYPGEVLNPATPEKAGEHYLVGYYLDETTVEWWAVDRCGATKTPVAPVHDGAGVGVAGASILECDPSDSTVWAHDPAGLAPPHVVFDSAASCRVVAVGDGLAAQEPGSGKVWFHPEPLSDGGQPILVTDRALPADPDDACLKPLQCELPDHSDGIRAEDGELIVFRDDASLLSFSAETQESDVLHDGPVREAKFLGDHRYLAVEPMGTDTFVIDRSDRSVIDFCCLGGFEPMLVLGEWLVRGSHGPPIIPEPETWRNFAALHLSSDERMEVIGTEDWSPEARLTENTLVIDIGPYWSQPQIRTIYWPDSDWRQRVELPGDTLWSSSIGDGVFSYDRKEENPGLYFLPSPDEPVRKLLTDEEITFVTKSDRIVYSPPHEYGDPVPLRVLTPDGRTVDLAPAATGVFSDGTSWFEWPLDTDEVLYLVRNEHGTTTLRRTVLP